MRTLFLLDLSKLAIYRGYINLLIVSFARFAVLLLNSFDHFEV